MSVEKVNGKFRSGIVPLNTNDCFGLQSLGANEIGKDCYCCFL